MTRDRWKKIIQCRRCDTVLGEVDPETDILEPASESFKVIRDGTLHLKCPNCGREKRWTPKMEAA